MSFISHMPPLEGGNYRVWREKYELALAQSENNLTLTSSCPTEPVDPVREKIRLMLISLLDNEIMQKCG